MVDRPWTGIALAALLVLGTAPASAGSFSARAIGLQDVMGSGRSRTVASPDGKSSVVARWYDDPRGSYVLLRTSGVIGSCTFRIADSPNSEILWAANSSAFFVTVNTGGIVGGFDLHVIGRFGGKLASRDLTPLVRRTFGRPVHCEEAEFPNVAGVTWTTPRRVLVAAEIQPHSVCDSPGTFKAYEVDPYRMKVMRWYGQLAVKARFADAIGLELKGADDDCVRRPLKCHVIRLPRRGSR